MNQPKCYAMAWDLVQGEMVDIVGILDGQWSIIPQIGRVLARCRNFDQLRDIWPNVEYLDNIDQMFKDGVKADVLHRCLSVFLDENWAQIVMTVWADLY